MNIQELFEQSGLSKQELANAAGVSLPTIYKVLKGEKIRDSTLQKLQSALQTTLPERSEKTEKREGDLPSEIGNETDFKVAWQVGNSYYIKMNRYTVSIGINNYDDTKFLVRACFGYTEGWETRVNQKLQEFERN